MKKTTNEAENVKEATKKMKSVKGTTYLFKESYEIRKPHTFDYTNTL